MFLHSAQMLELDHIAIAGESLDAATEFVEAALGVSLQNGGRHDHFGTYNRLLGLAGGLYLEVIAIDPAAPKPLRPRWFDLDRFSGPPRLTNWICRTTDIDAVGETVKLDMGAPIALTRGDLRWRMRVPDDGVLPYDNMCPAVIQWDCAKHPASLLAPSGCGLRRLVVTHPDATQLRDALSPALKAPSVVFETGPEPHLSAEFDTPHGLRVIG